MGQILYTRILINTGQRLTAASGELAATIGVSVVTLRRWDKAGQVMPHLRTTGGHRRYLLAEVLHQLGVTPPRLVVGYARVSSFDQKQDLARQKERLEAYFHCYGVGKVESALHAGFYPGEPPFQHGGIATVAGALCFYIVQAHAFADGNKRTAVVASTSFMALNGLKLSYPIDQKAGHNALADLVESCGASQVPKASMMKWFDHHKQSF